MAGNEAWMGRWARATSSIITGAPGRRCRLCRFCVAEEFSAWPRVDLITEDEFEVQLAAVATVREAGDRRVWFAHHEPFAHPRICHFLERATQLLPDRKLFVITSGLLLRPEHVERINAWPNVEIGLALNTLDPDVRRVLYGAPALERVHHALEHLGRVGVAITDCGSTELAERDLDRVLGLRAGRATSPILIRRLEHTRSSPPDIVRLSRASIGNHARSIERLLERVDVYSTTDLELVLRFGTQKSELADGPSLPSYHAAIHAALESRPEPRALFCSAPGSYAFWQRELARHRPAVSVVRVENATLGGSLDCAGFMTVADVRRTARNTDGCRVVLPRAMFGDLGQDMLGFARADLPPTWQVV